MDEELKSRLDYQFNVYSSSQGLVPLADAKAGAIIGANLALIATLVNAPFFMDKFFKIVNMKTPHQSTMMLFFLFCIFGLISTIFSLMVLYPRPAENLSKLRPLKLTFFEHIFACQSAERYIARVNETDGDSILQELCVQNFELSKILHLKYKFSKISLATFLIALIHWVFLLFNVFNFNI